jgi:hypothetical protein
MLKFLIQVAVSQEVTSIALLSSHESHNSDFPFPTTHGITLEICAEAAGVRSSNAVPVITSEIVVSKVVIVAMTKASMLRILDDAAAGLRAERARVGVVKNTSKQEVQNGSLSKLKLGFSLFEVDVGCTWALRSYCLCLIWMRYVEHSSLVCYAALPALVFHRNRGGTDQRCSPVFQG